MASDTPNDGWDEFWANYDDLRSGIGRSSAVNVNAARLTQEANQVVQRYFRQVRPNLLSLRIEPQELESLDHGMHDLLRLAQGRNARSSYVRILRNIGRQRSQMASLRESHLGEAVARGAPSHSEAHSETERQIIGTLRTMLPNAGASYQQGILDLKAGSRLSWRGTAVELREVLREVLDHLAPDADVMSEPTFKLEKDRFGPTMKQKAAFVLRSRGLSETDRRAPQDAIGIVDALTASFVRSTYERGSASTHGAPAREAVQRLKMYVDVALIELLQTTRPRK